MTVKATNKTGAAGGGILALLLAVILLAVFKLLPTLMSLALSFQDYSPSRGLANSAWVGMQNYQQLFANHQFSILVKNSLVLGLLGNLIPLALGTVIGFFTAKSIPDRLAGIGLAGWLLPVFIPEQVYGALVGWLCGAPVLGMPGPSAMAYLLCNGLRLLCFTVFVTGCCGWLTRRQKKGLTGVRVGGLAMGAMALASMFSPNRELLSTFQNSLNYESTDVLSTYVFRSGMMEAAYSLSSASWVTLLLIQLPGLLVGILLLMMGLRYLKQQKPRETGALPTFPAAIAGTTLALLAALAITLLFVSLLPGSLPASIGSYIFSSVLRTVLGTVAALIFMALLATGACRLPRLSLILPLVLVWLGQNLVGEYLLCRDMGICNTHLPDMIFQALNGGLLLPLVLLLLLAAGEEKSSLRKAVPFFILFGGLFAARIWGSVLYSTVYLVDREKYDLAMMVKELVIVNGGPTLSLSEGSGMTLLLSLYGILPVVLGAVCIFLFGRLIQPKTA